MRAHAYVRGHATRVRGCLFGYLALPQGYSCASKAGSTSSERIRKQTYFDERNGTANMNEIYIDECDLVCYQDKNKGVIFIYLRFIVLTDLLVSIFIHCERVYRNCSWFSHSDLVDEAT